MRADRHFCLSSTFAVLVVVLAFTHASRGEEPTSPVPPSGDSLQLPSRTIIKTSAFEAHPVWKRSFPPDHPFFANQYPEGKLQGMHSRYEGRLDGASVTLHENGKLKMLAFYPGGHLQGPCRVWDDDAKMLLFAQYKDDEKHGVTCLFNEGVPWFIQEWKKGVLENETIVARKGKDYVAVDDAGQLAKAKGMLSAVDKEVAENQSELKKTMRTWFAGASELVKKEKDKVLTRVAAAQSKERKQAIRQEADARAAAAGARRWGETTAGRVAGADEGFAAKDRKAANKNLNATTAEAKNKLHEMNSDLEQGSRELYEFAMAALETATRSEASEPETSTPGKEPDTQKTFAVTWTGSRGKRHTDVIRASSADGAKQEVLKQHSGARINKVEEK